MRLKPIVVLFVAMALVCATTVATAALRLSAANREIADANDARRQAQRDLRAARQQAERDLNDAREQTVEISAERIPNALAAATGESFEVRLVGCRKFNSCEKNEKLTVKVTRCGNDRHPCVAAEAWTDTFTALTLAGDTWSTSGTVPSGRVNCEGENITDATWEFTAKVVTARHSIAGGWRPATLDATFSVDIPARASCGSGALEWAGVASLE